MSENYNDAEQSRYETVLNQYSSAPGEQEIAQAVKRADETAEKTNTKTYFKNDGGKCVEHYHADGRPHMIEDFNADGKLSLLQRYYYPDIQVPTK